MSDMREIGRMTFAEYNLRVKAWSLRRLDEEYRLAKQAWLNREIGAKRRKGKKGYDFVYKEFQEFFDYEQQEKMILEGKAEPPAPADTAGGRYAEFLRKKKNG